MKALILLFSTGVAAIAATPLVTGPICLEEGECHTKEKTLADKPAGANSEWANDDAQHGPAEDPQLWDDDGAWGDDFMGDGSWVTSTPPKVAGTVCNVDGEIVADPADSGYSDDDGDGIIEVYIEVPYYEKVWAILPGDPPQYVEWWATKWKTIGPFDVQAGNCP